MEMDSFNLGMSEDDINLDTIDEWAQESLEHTMKRSFDSSSFLRIPQPHDDMNKDDGSTPKVKNLFIYKSF